MTYETLKVWRDDSVQIIGLNRPTKRKRDGDAVAEAELMPTAQRLYATEDAAIGVEALLSRTQAEFVGR